MNPHTTESVIAWLRATGSQEERDGLSRFGIPSRNAFGVPMRLMKAKAKEIGRDHALATSLWEHGAYEARTMAVFLADPAVLTSAQTDTWCADFDNWAICDTACFHLFDRTSFAWEKVSVWGPDSREFVRRACFALIWALSRHDESAQDATFTGQFDLFRLAALDDRPPVRKAVDMALRATGKRNAALNASARELAKELAASESKSARWVGTHALRELESAKVQAGLERGR